MSTFDNPYAPVSNVGVVQRAALPLASIGKRFAGFLVELVIGFIMLIPGYALMLLDPGMAQPTPELGAMGLLGMLWLLVGGLSLFAIQIYLLVTRSQTIGKFFVKTQIVDFETGEPAGFVKAGLLRLFVSGLISSIPCVGGVYALVDHLFIFREDRRCIHDLIAGTNVVDIG
jgi:uncharacterized RDD family membrane protein YckC